MSFDAAFRSDEAYFGLHPDPVLTEYAEGLDSRYPVIDVGMGQGRNAVWLAQRGFSVDGIEPSIVAHEKVCHMVAEEGLSVHAYPCTFEEFESQAEGYGGVLAFGLLPILSWRGVDALRSKVDEWLIQNGLVFLTAFTTDDPAHAQIARRWSKAGPHSFVDAQGNRRTYLEPGQLPRLFEGYELVYGREYMGPMHRHGDGPLHQHAMAEAVLRRP